MGGSIKQAFSNPIRALTAVGTFGTSELARRSPLLNPLAKLPENVTNKLLGTHYGDTGSPDIGGGGPFQLDTAQSTADQEAIRQLGQKQYDQTMSELPKNVNNAVLQSLPGIQEKLNSQHLLNGTALPAEIARQQETFAQNLAVPAMQQLQGTQTGALQRGLSLEDFINQANVSKTIGQTFAPQQPSGKQNFGTIAQGVGALAPWGKLAMGGKGAANAASG